MIHEQVWRAATVNEQNRPDVAIAALPEQGAITRERLGGVGRIEQDALAASRERQRLPAVGGGNAIAGADEAVRAITTSSASMR